MKLYCYAPQVDAARALLESCGIRLLTPLCPVQSREAFRGLNGGVLFVVDNHDEPIPAAIEAAAERAGMVWICLTDEWVREMVRK